LGFGNDLIGSTVLQVTLEDNRDRLCRFMTARCRDSALAEDLIQEASIKVATHKPREPIADPLAYLYRMCENLVRDAMRADLRRQSREMSWREQTHGPDARADDVATPERLAVERDLLGRTLDALNELPDRTRAIFIAYRVDGTSQKQIAAEQGISLSAVEKHLQRAYRLVLDIRARFDAGEG
jgi:RNA polymerase sigma-70 factor (ECF subfamily)